MKKLIIPFVLIMFALVACDKESDNPAEDTLYVKFINDASSEFTITTIELRSRGIAGQENQPIGEWGSNVLTGGETLAPGASKFFTLDIPTSNWSEYRIGVNDGTGTTVMVQQSDNVGVDSDLPITHWGGDDRTVSVIVRYNANYDLIYIAGWSDWVGIDK
ncbi:MAG: hypothetical protein JW729_09735 [Bacteroidales bacterium]|nr:hypothetical protein [Bacteroidales bacterium]